MDTNSTKIVCSSFFALSFHFKPCFFSVYVSFFSKPKKKNKIHAREQNAKTWKLGMFPFCESHHHSGEQSRKQKKNVTVFHSPFLQAFLSCSNVFFEWRILYRNSVPLFFPVFSYYLPLFSPSAVTEMHQAEIATQKNKKKNEHAHTPTQIYKTLNDDFQMIQWENLYSAKQFYVLSHSKLFKSFFFLFCFASSSVSLHFKANGKS